MQQQQADGSYKELWPKVDGWNKSQVLSDLTRELLGLESTSIPDDAFIALTVGKDSKAYRVKVTYPNGQPAVGFTVGGLTPFPALGLVTNANGMVMGSSTSTNPTITVAQKYDDVKSYSGSFTSTRMITDCNVVLEWDESSKEIKSSTTLSFNNSSWVEKIELLIVAAGGGIMTDRPFISRGGNGGGSGGENKLLQWSNLNNKISIVIGAYSNNSNGGNTIVTSGGEIIGSTQGGIRGSSTTYKSGTRLELWSYGGAGGPSSGENSGKGGAGGGRYNNDYDEDSSPSIINVTNPTQGSGGKTYNFGGKIIHAGYGGPGGCSHIGGKGEYKTSNILDFIYADGVGQGAGGSGALSNESTYKPGNAGVVYWRYIH